MCLFTCGSSNQTRPQHQGPNNLTPQNRNSSKIGILQLTSINQIQTQIPESKTTEQKYQTDSPTSRRPSITHSSSENGRKFTQQKNHSDETKIPNSSDEENIKIRVVRPISTKFQTQKPQQYSEQQRPFSIKLNTPYLHEETKETESKDTDSIHLDFSDIASGFDKETYESIKRNRESLINKIREFQQNLDYDNLKLLINYLLDDLISAKATKTSKKISHEERQYTTYIIETIKTEPNNRTTTLGNYDVLYRWIQDNDLYKKLLEHFKFPREIKDEISQELQQLNLEDQFAGKVMTLLFFTSNKSPKILNIMSKTTEECSDEINEQVNSFKTQLTILYTANTINPYSEATFAATKKLQKLVRQFCGIMTFENKCLIDIVYDNMDKKTKDAFAQFLSCNFNFENNPYLKALSTTYAEIFPHQERTSSLANFGSQNFEFSKGKITRRRSQIANSVRIRQGITGTVNNYDRYFKIVNTKNTSQHILNALQKFSEFYTNKMTESEKESMCYFLNYLQARQETSQSIYTSQTNISNAAEAFTKNLETYHRMSFSAGWKEHSICIQFQESNENNSVITNSQRDLMSSDLNTVTIRLFNAGNKAVQIKKSDDEIRAVREYKNTFSPNENKHDAIISIATNFFSIFINQTEENDAVNEINNTLEKCQFTEILIENSQLGQFETDPQVSGNCLLRSLLEEIRGLMILELGIKNGQELFQKFYYFCSTYTPTRVPTEAATGT